MTVDDFRQSLTAAKPPAELTLALAGLWWDARGDWKRAHESAQRDEGPDGSWVHAYLHRKEGDQGNALYWYGRAGETCLPRSARCRMAQYRERFAEMLTKLIPFVAPPVQWAERIMRKIYNVFRCKEQPYGRTNL